MINKYSIFQVEQLNALHGAKIIAIMILYYSLQYLIIPFSFTVFGHIYLLRPQARLQKLKNSESNLIDFIINGISGFGTHVLRELVAFTSNVYLFIHRAAARRLKNRVFLLFSYFIQLYNFLPKTTNSTTFDIQAGKTINKI